MGLDIYAGPLTRYFAGDWLTVVQQYGIEQGMEVRVVRPGDPSPDADEKPDNALVQELVQAWRNAIIRSLSDHLDDVRPWNESMEAEYDTDKPDWDGLGSVILWAAYDQCPDLTPPTEAARAWQDDPAYARMSEQNGGETYKALLRGCEVWLPIEMPGTFEGPLPNERTVTFGSVSMLLDNLEALNQATWQADLSDASGEGMDKLPPATNTFEEAARFGFSLLYRLTRFAHDNRTPMILDY